MYHFINGRWKFLISNPGKPFGGPNRWVQRWLASCDPPKPRVLTSLLPLPGINITMQTCLCQLNLFSNFPQGERVPLTPCPCLPSISLQLSVFLSSSLFSPYFRMSAPLVFYLSVLPYRLKVQLARRVVYLLHMLDWLSRGSRQEQSAHCLLKQYVKMY